MLFPILSAPDIIMRHRFAPLASLLGFFWCALALGMGTIKQGQFISHPQTITSASGNFELGFFTPGNTSKYYVGIWHAKVSDPHVVWVANRDYPFLNSSANLTISSNGNIVILDGKVSYKVTEVSTSGASSAVLLDSGNLVLIDGGLEVLWQSFEYPTDTILPKMRSLASYSDIVSWRSLEDPYPGSFSIPYFQFFGNFTIMKQDSKRTYWSGYYDGWFPYDPESRMIWKIQLDVFGQLKLQNWSEDAQQWVTLKSSKCESHLCGDFSICDVTADEPCRCLPGFRNVSVHTSEGCLRKTNLQCDHNDKFLWMQSVYFPSGSMNVSVGSAAGCVSFCLSHCSCIGYSFDSKSGCLAWDRDLFGLKQLPTTNDTYNGGDFYLKLAASELINMSAGPANESVKNHKNTSKKMQLWTIVILTTCLSMLILGLLVHYARRKLSQKGEDLLKYNFAMSLADDTEFNKVDKPGSGSSSRGEVKLPLFSFASVSAATNNFSPTNKLGEGGFGPVYKGTLLNGDEIAVKRLSRRSGQGWEELKNEALLIAKLQHKNLVRLLGYCIERDEKILIYEYMPNKSLDFFLFDATKRRILNWGIRVQIIEGIAQGLLYLHQYSRLRIIHRDLKAGNILLDGDMSPKISDFGMARIFGGTESHANTDRIVGTYGYMSPEYALEGLFSVKSDVFSFGVLLLEIVSGKKNTGLYQTSSLHLLGYAWDFWTSNRGLNLVDPELLEEVLSAHMEIALRFVNIGLLCVQESADDRPTMQDVVSMLSNETMVLASPKQPAFLNVRSTAHLRLQQGRTETCCSVNDVTCSLLEAR